MPPAPPPPQSASPAPSTHLTLRVVLLIGALLGLVGAALELPEFPLSRNVEPHTGLYQVATNIRPVLGPALAILALILAAVGRLRVAIATLATLTLVNWLIVLAWLVPSGGALPPIGTGAMAFTRAYIDPVLAAAALALLPWRRGIGLAATLAVIPVALAILFFAFYFILVRMPD